MFKDTIKTMMNAKFEHQIVAKNKICVSNTEEKIFNFCDKELSTTKKEIL